MTERAEIYEFLEAKERDHTAVVSWIHRGDYEEPQLYARGDVVRMRGASYVAVSDCPGDCPTDGWQLVAEVGERGEKGARGEQGYTGKQGMAGPPGEMGPPGRSIRWRGRYVPFTSYSRDDVVYFDNALFIALREPSDEAPKADQINWDLMIRFHAPDMTEVFRQINDHSDNHEKPDGVDTIASMMYMVAGYVPGAAVKQGAVAVSHGWTMHASQDTDEPAAPEAVGDPYYLYDGANPIRQETIQQVISGTRFTSEIEMFITGYRVYVQGGTVSVIYVVVNPGADEDIQQLGVFTPAVDGWVDIPSGRTLVPSGSVFDLLVQTRAADPVQVTWDGLWNYTTPNNPNTPGVGVCSHSNKELDIIRFNKTAQNGDRSAQLLALVPGDTIIGPGLSWTIQGVTEVGNTVHIEVLPASQAIDGEDDFIFGITEPSPIDFLEDAGYWAANPSGGGTVEGILQIDGGATELNSNAYGTDVLVQPAQFSSDWDFMAYSG